MKVKERVTDYGSSIHCIHNFLLYLFTYHISNDDREVKVNDEKTEVSSNKKRLIFFREVKGTVRHG